MANPEHVEILKQGFKIWNKWRADNQIVDPDLRDIDFYRANLLGADLHGAKLHRCYLREADLYRTDLHGANLLGADLSGSDLCKADLNGTDLRGANLLGADLSGSDLSKADLSGARLREARLIGASLLGAILSESDLSGADLRLASCWYTLFVGVDLSKVTGLETVLHEGPSTIDIDTLFKSKGNIPETFLRGCGVPDSMIEYTRSLTNSPFEYYSCFISYSHKDEEFAQRIHNDLQARGVRCWYAPHDIQGGKKIHHQIDDAIRVYDKLLLILSPNSMDSNWVGSEIIRAKKKEDRQDSQMLFPVSIVQYQKIQDWEFFDSDSGRDLAREIREYFIPDFSLWKSDHDAYSKAFERLLRDLKAG